MAPVSRCNLRLPCKLKPPKTSTPTDEKAPPIRGLDSTSATKLSDPVSIGGSAKSKLSDPDTSDAAKSTSNDGSPKLNLNMPRMSERLGKSQEFPDGMGVDLNIEEDAEKVPEAEQNAGPDVGGELDACEILRRCKAEVEASGECEQMACPRLDQIGTPGDVCAQFCHDRMDSPKSVAEAKLLTSRKKKKYCAKWSKKGKGKVDCDMRLGPRKRRGSKPEDVCKGTYKTEETYTSLWGSSKAMAYRGQLEIQMKKKRNLLEKMHRKEFLRKQKMRRRAKEKRRALKRRDPSKIPNGDDNLRINKAYDLRVNYNKQLPMMPVTMQQHFDKFKKPPFKTYVPSRKLCTKRIAEFEKLRVPEKNKK